MVKLDEKLKNNLPTSLLKVPGNNVLKNLKWRELDWMKIDIVRNLVGFFCFFVFGVDFNTLKDTLLVKLVR